MTLAQARERTADIRRMILDGVDPREARRAAAVAAAKTITFDKAVDAYIESHRAGWKSERHARLWKSTLQTYASPKFGKLPVAAIDVGLVMRALQPIWKIEKLHRVPVAGPHRGGAVVVQGARLSRRREPGGVAG